MSGKFGFDRGQPIDRYYIESFLKETKSSIHGSVLEIGDNYYTKKFGDIENISSHVLHAVRGNVNASFVGNLETGEGVPQGRFDCIICTQTFSCIYRVEAAVKNTFSALRQGGTLLATVPGISQISRYDMERWGDYWRFTDLSAKRLFADVFGEKNVEVRVFGNVLTACSFLNGLASHELSQEDLDYRDRDYQVLIAVKAVRQGSENC